MNKGAEHTFEEGQSNGLSFGVTLLMLIMCTGIVYLYELEADLQLLTLLVLVVVGFSIHRFLPPESKIFFLLLLNIVGLFVLFDPMVAAGSVALGMTIIALADTQMPHGIKKGALIAIGVGIAGLTQMTSLDPRIQGIASLVGILFMFRIISYLHERNIKLDKTTYWHRLSYFFILPNYVFYIFPIIDYKTYIQKYQTSASPALFRKGIIWISVGVFQLLLYRLIYYFLLPAPSEVDSWFLLFKYLIYSYLLILRLLGLFELSVGVLCLFGFDLPRTFKNVFLADSFNDIWRRINTYYREFIMKIVYYPIYFKLKKYWSTPVILTIFIVFFFNWFFHAYQWFWVLKVFPLKLTDIGFWLLFALLVAVGSWMQLKREKRPGPGVGWVGALTRSLKVVGMFLSMCLLWAFWTSDSLSEFVNLWKVSNDQFLQDGLRISSVILSSIVVIAALFKWDQESGKISQWDQLSVKKRNVLGGIGIVLLVGGLGPVREAIQSVTQVDLSGAYESRLNKYDEEKQFKGYYESLITPTSLTSRVWEIEKAATVQNSKNLGDLKMVKRGDFFLQKDLIPYGDTIFKGKRLTINEFGLRDRSNYYHREKDPQTLRIALLGGSIELGGGVLGAETFENVLEDKLNANHIWPGYEKIEILNFAVSGTYLPHHVYRAETQVADFNPDVIIYTAHHEERRKSFDSFTKLLKSKDLSRYPELQEIAIHEDMENKDPFQAVKALWKYNDQLYEWGMKRIHKQYEDKGVIKLWLYIPSLRKKMSKDYDKLKSVVEKYGFLCFDFRDAYQGYELELLKLGKWDGHPNAAGHQILADALYEKFSTDYTLDSVINQRYFITNPNPNK